MKKEIQLKFKLEYNIDPKKSGFYSQILRFSELLELYGLFNI